jgi:3-hydroxy acid dehydrogenase/malonic semialdehyde reductase
VYGATKAFVAQFSLGLRADLVGTGVRVSTAEPGLAGGTEFSNVRFRGDDARAQAVYANTTPLAPEDVADAVHWIATRPAHVNIMSFQMFPECQAFSALAVKRASES